MRRQLAWFWDFFPFLSLIFLNLVLLKAVETLYSSHSLHLSQFSNLFLHLRLHSGISENIIKSLEFELIFKENPPASQKPSKPVINIWITWSRHLRRRFLKTWVRTKLKYCKLLLRLIGRMCYFLLSTVVPASLVWITFCRLPYKPTASPHWELINFFQYL